MLDAASQIADMHWLDQEEAPFDELPPGCKEVWLPELLEARGTTSTLVIRYDIDRDGTRELIAWDGDPGSGVAGGSCSCFELEGFNLIHKASFDVECAEPIRQKPRRISIASK